MPPGAPTQNEGPPSATHYIASNHEGGQAGAYHDVVGECYFCGSVGGGLPVEDVVSEEYFSDHSLRRIPESDVICSSCAYCMDHREVKQGHWIANADTFRRVPTGDLLSLFQKVRGGDIPTPLALHVSENPIRSEHAYLWTPVAHTKSPLVLSYGRQTVLLNWREFDRLLNAVEELRWHGFRGDDILSGEPRVRDLASVGGGRYRELDGVIEPHRATPVFEVVWTVSRNQDDQPEPPRWETHDNNTTARP